MHTKHAQFLKMVKRPLEAKHARDVRAWCVSVSFAKPMPSVALANRYEGQRKTFKTVLKIIKCREVVVFSVPFVFVFTGCI